MVKMIISIPHISWRDGKPRYQPGPRLRKLGEKGESLRHPDGAWFTAEEARVWAEAKTEALAGEAPAVRPGPKPARQGLATVGELVERLFELPEFQVIENPAHRRREGALAPKTIRWYRGIANQIKRTETELWVSPAAAVSRKVAKNLYRKLRAERGVKMSTAMIGLLRRTFNEFDEELTGNPFNRLRMKTPATRIRYGSVEEMERLIAAADALRREDVGDMIMLGLMTGQRQNDRLGMTGGQIVEGKCHFRQSKTGAVVWVPATPHLKRRLNRSRARRRALNLKVDYPHVCLDEHNRRGPRPWHPDGDHYRAVFAEIRAAAVRGIKDDAGDWIVRPLQSLADFRDQDLRDTAVTWLALARCEIYEIAAITGHEITDIHAILKHYLGIHPTMAETAIGKMVAWLDKQGVTL